MMGRWRVAGWALMVSTACVNAAEISPYIVNGTTTDLTDYPTFASLFYKTDSVYQPSSFCGATLINSRYVLTAAHCIYGDDDLMLYTVVAPGLDDEDDFLNAEQARASEFYYPDNYQNSEAALWPNDIAIIKLETAVSASDYTYLINSTVNNSFSASDTFKAVGHGLIEGGADGGTQARDTTLDYVSTATCRSEFGSNITSKQLCFSGEISAGYRNSTCSGDSGGPVYWDNGVEFIQVGITSFGPSLCGDQSVSVTSVFTDVYDYQDWIERVINGQETPKTYVVTSNGQRRLVYSTETASSPSSGGGGGSSGLLFFVLLLLSGTLKWQLRDGSQG